ncbi:Transmembrane ascorbate ferrireductase 1, partial [Cucurbita argyrosperma subsp. argyrosperma]
MMPAVKAFPFTIISHGLAVVALIMVLIWTIHFRGGLAWESVNKSLIFNVHPVFMLFGLIIIGGEAIISYKSLPFRKEVKKVIHLALNGVALVLGIVGISAAFKNHNESGIANLYSLHSWIGIGVIVLYGIQVFTATLPWHALLGACVYVLAAANSALGFLEKLTFLQSSGVAKYGTEALLVNFTAITTVVFAVFVILS